MRYHIKKTENPRVFSRLVGNFCKNYTLKQCILNSSMSFIHFTGFFLSFCYPLEVTMSYPSYHKNKVVFDTSVILYDASAFQAFPKTDIHIPLCVIEEIDKFKRDAGETGRNARQFSRFVDTLRSQGSLTEGVKLQSGSYVFVDMLSDVPPLPGTSQLKADDSILSVAIDLKKNFPKASVELISKDINLRIKSDVFGVRSKDYDPDKVGSIDEIYTGIKHINVKPEVISKFFKQGSLGLPEASFFSNQYAYLKSEDKVALARFDKKTQRLQALIQPDLPVWRVHPRNFEQSCAFDALLNDEILFVSLVGKAGTGKTLLALAAGLHKAMDEGKYQRLLVSRPIFPMGRDIGYLPGDIEQKLNPWMQPIFDSLEFIMGMGKKAGRLTQDLIDQGLLNIEPLAYIRGRSLPRQYLIIDEAQNLTPHEVKTIITRAGQGTKIILTGDCYQIDNPYVDASNSGLTYSIEKFKSESISAHVTLNKGERSELAELAANLL